MFCEALSSEGPGPTDSVGQPPGDKPPPGSVGAEAAPVASELQSVSLLASHVPLTAFPAALVSDGLISRTH